MTDTPHIGLYICHCGHNIAGVVSPVALADAARGLPGVAVCRDHLYSCSEAGQSDIAKDIQQFGLNRLVVAACSPKLHEPTFRRLLAENGVNPYLLEIVNLREHCSWVHAREPDAALVKALELIRMGLAKVRDAVPLAERQVPLTRAALVIGGGPAGLRAALDIAHAGIPVTLVERAPVLGGMANRLYKTFPQGQSAVSLINPMMAAVMLHPGITVLTDSAVTEVGGHLGSYRVKVAQTRPRVGKACDLCGECAAVCPVKVTDEGQTGAPPRAAIYRPSPTAFPARYLVDAAHCDRCGLCVAACPRQAIILEAEGEIEPSLKVGSIVLATGFAPFDPLGSRYAAWAALPQVITTVDLERRLDPRGPTGGRVITTAAAPGHRLCPVRRLPGRRGEPLLLPGLLPHRPEAGPGTEGPFAPGPHPHLLPGYPDGQEGMGGPLHPGPGGRHRLHAGQGQGYPAH